MNSWRGGRLRTLLANVSPTTLGASRLDLTASDERWLLERCTGRLDFRSARRGGFVGHLRRVAAGVPATHPTSGALASADM
jgi:hypothetical protein